MTKKRSTKRPNEYLAKPYARILTPDPEANAYVAQILEFPGCIAEGETPAEAYSNLERAADAWIGAALASGQTIPDPTFEKIRDFSGKVALRLPRRVHREAVRFAEIERTSLNTFLVSAVSAAVGATSFYEHLSRKLEAQVLQGIQIIGAATAAGISGQRVYALNQSGVGSTRRQLAGTVTNYG